MSNVLLGQAWVSRVMNSEHPDISANGGGKCPLPDTEELKEVLRKLAVSDAAREMVRRKWIQPAGIKDKIAERAEALFEFLFPRGGFAMGSALAMFRGRRMNLKRDLLDEISTIAWITHVTETAQAKPCNVSFRESSLNDSFIRHLAVLSVHKDGPMRALNALRDIGVNVVVERGLPGMSVDGASFHKKGIGPVLAMTLRYDRLDNFWFTLLHEVGHIALHLAEPNEDVFVDSLEEGPGEDQEAEAEADAFARDGLIPRDTWLRSEAHLLGDKASVIGLANQLGIHPAIVAGRIRYERREFRIFPDLVGEGGVREVIFSG